MNREYYCPRCDYEKFSEESKRMAEDKYRQVKEEMKKKREMADEYIRSNPEKAVLIAAGTGMLAGLILAGIIAKKSMHRGMYR